LEDLAGSEEFVKIQISDVSALATVFKRKMGASGKWGQVKCGKRGWKKGDRSN
jgi:hypothetical protein